jgi:hypothetical protein
LLAGLIARVIVGLLLQLSRIARRIVQWLSAGSIE